MGIVLSPPQGVQPAAAEIEAALDAAGWSRWDGNGNPDIAVFHSGSPKGDYFEAGFWAGRGVMLFFVGGGSRCHKRKNVVSRIGGWTIVGENNRADLDDLIAAIGRWERKGT